MLSPCTLICTVSINNLRLLYDIYKQYQLQLNAQKDTVINAKPDQ